MTATRLQQAEQRRLHAELLRAMVTNLRALLDGRITRPDVIAWTREVWPPSRGQGAPFAWGTANAVFNSLYCLGERWQGREFVRDVDLRGYLRWLTEGDLFVADEDGLIVLERDIDDLAAQVGGEPIRWWLGGLGWAASLQFAAPPRGRPFLAQTLLEGPGPGRLGICKLRSDDCNDAIVDLFEALAIDDGDVAFIDPAVDLTRLPVWALWREDDNCNRFEIARYRSYAKARAQEQIFTDRGHKQIYWVDPA